MIVEELCLKDRFKEIITLPVGGKHNVITDQLSRCLSPNIQLTTGTQSSKIVFLALQSHKFDLTSEVFEFKWTWLEYRLLVDLIDLFLSK